MGKKKKKREEEYKPWCYYCNRLFNDETTLIQHQKNKHFKCMVCNKKMTTAPSLAIHCSHVHKKSLDKVPGALLERDSLELEIFGMAGIPDGTLPPKGSTGDEGSKEPETKVARVDQTGYSAPLPGIGYYQQPGPGVTYARSGGYGQPQMYPSPYGAYPGMHSQLPAGAMSHRPAGNLPYPYSHAPQTGGYTSSVGPPLNLHSGAAVASGPMQPLFPISNGPAPAALPLTLSAPSSTATSHPVSAAPAGATLEALPASDAKVVWEEHMVSMEERRAQLPKYNGR